MFSLLHAQSADELWLKAADWFRPDGMACRQSGRGGDTLEVLHAALSLDDPRQRWVGVREPAMSPAFAIAEVVWILAGRNDSAFLNYFNQRLPDFAGTGDTYHGAYGFRLRNAFGVDQLKRAAAALRGQTHSRQVVLQIWDSQRDLPFPDGKPVNRDIPCNVISMLKVRSGRLEWTQVMRSNDLFLGLPHNIVQFTTLQEVLAGWIGVDVGGYHHLSDSLHLYEHDDYILEHAKGEPCPRNEDRLNLPEQESEAAVQALSNMAEQIIQPAVLSGEVIRTLVCAKLPQGFRNLLAILTAEGCRRRGQLEDANRAIAECQNSCLLFLWDRWMKRKARQN